MGRLLAVPNREIVPGCDFSPPFLCLLAAGVPISSRDGGLSITRPTDLPRCSKWNASLGRSGMLSVFDTQSQSKPTDSRSIGVQPVCSFDFHLQLWTTACACRLQSAVLRSRTYRYYFSPPALQQQQPVLHYLHDFPSTSYH